MYSNEINPFTGRIINFHTAIKKICANFEMFEIKSLLLNTGLIALDLSLFSQNKHLAKSNAPRTVEDENGTYESN